MPQNWYQVVFIVILCILLGYIRCQITNELDVDGIEKQINEIKGLEKYNRSNLPTEEELEKVLKEKCEQNGGGEEAFNALKNQQVEIKNCLESKLNTTELQEELEVAKKTGSMDEVFGKYCKRYPEVRDCVQNVTESVKPCLDTKEQDSVDKIVKLIEELQEFLCFKDGDRIAMFIAEGGIECLQSKRDELQECANQTLGARIPTDLSVNNLPTLVFSERDCNDFDEIRTCVNTELEKCSDSTPANIVDAFFKFLRRHIPCGNKETQKVAQSQRSSANVLTVTSYIIVTTSFVLSRFY